MASASLEEGQSGKPSSAYGIPFILFNGFCDRFTYYGIKAILILYFVNVLLMEESSAKEIYHLFFMFCTIVPLFGAVLADSFLGNFKTILIFTIVYILGNSVLTLAAIPPLSLPVTATSIIGLGLLAIGTGCVKSCVIAFGGDQYELPAQEKALSSYFSNFYLVISVGGLGATFLMPILRQEVTCFNGDCFSLAYAVTTASMVLALVALLIGKPFCKSVPPAGQNVVMEVFRCIWVALKTKYKKGKSSTALHWLDNASGEFEDSFIRDVKSALKLLVLFLFFPMFWALMEQQGSAWTLQAKKMDGKIFGITLKPDHMQAISPLLVLILVPLFTKVIYPGLAKINVLKKPVERLALGGILAALAFVMSGVIQLKLESNDNSALQHEFRISSVNTSQLCLVNLTYIQDEGHQMLQGMITNGSLKLAQPAPKSGLMVLEIHNLTHCLDNEDSLDENITKPLLYEAMKNFTSLSENSIEEPQLHMLWLTMQFVTIAIAEALFAVTGTEFSYSQAPSSMKSLMQSAWLLTIAMGNLIVAVISRLNMFSLQSHEVFFYAAVMLADIILFVFVASSYDMRRPLSRASSRAFSDLRCVSIRNDPGEKVVTRRRTA